MSGLAVDANKRVSPLLAKLFINSHEKSVCSNLTIGHTINIHLNLQVQLIVLRVIYTTVLPPYEFTSIIFKKKLVSNKRLSI